MDPDILSDEIASIFTNYGDKAKATTSTATGLTTLTVRPATAHSKITVELTIPDTYPANGPEVGIEGMRAAEAVELRARLEHVMTAHSGQPMLSALLSAASEFIQNSYSDKLENAPAEKQDKMRPAEDVISRIRWDDRLDGNDFVVGYLDRFRGELEISFADVDWDEPFFPQHRIQCFKFKEEIVWDKRVTLDNVFGSRGDGIKIEDVIAAAGRTTMLRHVLCLPVKERQVMESVKRLQNKIKASYPECFEDLSACALNLILFSFEIPDASTIEALKVLKSFRLQFAMLRDIKIQFRGLEMSEQGVVYLKAVMSRELCILLTLLEIKLSEIGLKTSDETRLPHVAILHAPKAAASGFELWKERLLPFKDSDCGESSMTEMLLMDPNLEVVFALGNGVVHLDKRLPSLIQDRLEVLFDNGCVFADEMESLSERLESSPVTNLELERSLMPSFMHVAWDIYPISGLLIIFHSCHPRKQQLMQILQQKQDSLCIISTTTDKDPASNNNAQLVTSLIDAVEAQEDLILLSDMNSVNQCDLFKFISQLLGYQVKTLDFENPDKDDLSINPGDSDVKIPNSLTERELADWISEMMNKTEGQREDDGNWEALCVFLTARSCVDLVRRIVPVHDYVFGDCVVLLKHPHPHQLRELPLLGSVVRMEVQNMISNQNLQAVRVQLAGQYRRMPFITQHPTIIISANHPKASDLESGTQQERISNHIELHGILGLLISFQDGRPPRKVIWNELLTQTAIPSDPKLLTGDIEVLTRREARGITELNIFDFDGTLMNSPGEFVGRQEYAQISGVPYPHRGWWGRPESLLPPVRVLPGPALRDCMAQYGRSGTWTVILTGRIFRMQSAVESVLRHYGVGYDALICKKTSADTQNFKISTVLSLVQRFEGLKKIRVWEDNVENLVMFYELAQSLKGRIELEVFEAPNMPPPRSLLHKSFSWEGRDHLKGIGAFLESMGRSPDRNFWLHAQAGIAFIAALWRDALGLECKVRDLCFVMGCSPFGCQADVDLKLLAPIERAQEDCMHLLCQSLQDKTVEHNLFEGVVQIRLYFEQCCPVDVHVGFVRIREEALGKPIDSSDDLKRAADVQDPQTCAAIAGLETQEYVRSLDKRAGEKRRVALEMMDQLLKTNGLENKLHSWLGTCVLQLVAAFHKIVAPSNEQSVDRFCTAFLRWIADLTADEILKYCGLDVADPTVSSHREDAVALVTLGQHVFNILGPEEDSLEWTNVYDLLIKRHLV